MGEEVVTEDASVSCVGRPVMVAPGRCVRIVWPGEKPSLSATIFGSSLPTVVACGIAPWGMATRFLVTVVVSSTR